MSDTPEKKPKRQSAVAILTAQVATLAQAVQAQSERVNAVIALKTPTVSQAAAVATAPPGTAPVVRVASIPLGEGGSLEIDPKAGYFHVKVTPRAQDWVTKASTILNGVESLRALVAYLDAMTDAQRTALLDAESVFQAERPRRGGGGSASPGQGQKALMNAMAMLLTGQR